MYAVITCVEEGAGESFAVKVVLAGKVPPTTPQKVPESPFVCLLRLNSFLPPRGTSSEKNNKSNDNFEQRGKIKIEPIPLTSN